MLQDLLIKENSEIYPIFKDCVTGIPRLMTKFFSNDQVIKGVGR